MMRFKMDFLQNDLFSSCDLTTSNSCNLNKSLKGKNQQK